MAYHAHDVHTDIWISAFKIRDDGSYFHSFERLNLTQYHQSDYQMFFKKTMKHTLTDYDGCRFVVYVLQQNTLERLKVVVNDPSQFVKTTSSSQFIVLKRPDLQKYQFVLVVE